MYYGTCIRTGVVQSALECSKGFAPNSAIPPWVRVFAMLTGKYMEFEKKEMNTPESFFLLLRMLDFFIH